MNATREQPKYPSSLNGGQPQDDNETRLGEEHRRPLDPGRQDGSDDGQSVSATEQDTAEDEDVA